MVGEKESPSAVSSAALPKARVDQLRDRVLPVERPRIDLDAELRELGEVRLALLDLFVV